MIYSSQLIKFLTETGDDDLPSNLPLPEIPFKWVEIAENGKIELGDFDFKPHPKKVVNLTSGVQWRVFVLCVTGCDVLGG